MHITHKFILTYRKKGNTLPTMNSYMSFDSAEKLGHRLTDHAARRLHSRRFNGNRLELAIAFWREVHANGITFYVVGQKEVMAARRTGVDISAAEGMHVLCSREGEVVTVYKNHDLRDTRPRASSRDRRGRRKVQ